MGKPLTPELLVDDFGAASPIARDGIRALYEAITTSDRGDARACFERWEALFRGVSGRGAGDAPARHDDLADLYGVPRLSRPAELLFALHTYYALFLARLSAAIVEAPGEVRAAASFDEALFAWYTAARSDGRSDGIKRLERALSARLDAYDPCALDEESLAGRDHFKRIYQQLFPRSVRRDLGEYYTPDWLARHVLDSVGYEGDPGERLLDPACGSGTLLILAIQRIRAWYEQNRARCGYDERELARRILANVVGLDVHPLAVLTAKTSYLIAIRGLLRRGDAISIPVYLYDSIVGQPITGAGASAPPPLSGAFSSIVGNPPWVNWRGLSEPYRRRVAPLFLSYGLFPQKGIERRLGAGMDDVSALMTYVCAERYLAPSGKLGFVLPQTLFQSAGGGRGFRKLALPSGRFLKVERVYDFTSLQAFEGAGCRAASVALSLSSAPTAYPVDYVRVEPLGSQSAGCVAPIGGSPLRVTRLEGAPVSSDEASPWSVLPAGLTAAIAKTRGRSPYVARVGAHSGGAAGAYWVDVVAREGDLAVIANRGDAGRTRYPSITTAVEGALVRSLLRGRDVTRWAAAPSLSIVMPYDAVNGGKAIPEPRMRRAFPRALAYFESLKEPMTARPHFTRHFKRAGAPYWSMYNVGDYTFAAHRVVWREQARTFQCAVVEGEPGGAPVADHKLVVVACGSSDEAHYLAAALNSSPARLAVESYVIDVQISTHVLKYLSVPRFSPDDARHQELASRSRACHEARRAGRGGELAAEELEIDRLAASMWGITPTELSAIRAPGIAGA